MQSRLCLNTSSFRVIDSIGGNCGAVSLRSLPRQWCMVGRLTSSYTKLNRTSCIQNFVPIRTKTYSSTIRGDQITSIFTHSKYFYHLYTLHIYFTQATAFRKDHTLAMITMRSLLLSCALVNAATAQSVFVCIFRLIQIDDWFVGYNLFWSRILGLIPRHYHNELC